MGVNTKYTCCHVVNFVFTTFLPSLVEFASAHGSGKEDSLQTEGQTDDIQQVIRNNLTLAFNSGEIKRSEY